MTRRSWSPVGFGRSALAAREFSRSTRRGWRANCCGNAIRSSRSTPFTGTPPEDRPAIIFSPADPPVGWFATDGGYYPHTWSGPPQLWVKNLGNVYEDTDALVSDLCSYLAPQREKPLPFPDANYDLVAREGEAPAGRGRRGGLLERALRHTEARSFRRRSGPPTGADRGACSSTPDRDKKNILKLRRHGDTTRAGGGKRDACRPGWWLVVRPRHAAAAGTGWAIRSPKSACRRPHSSELLAPGERRTSSAVSFDLGRLKVDSSP